MENNHFQKGDIYKLLSEQEEYILIVSQNQLNEINSFVEIIFLQTKPYKNSHLLVEVHIMDKILYAVCDQIHTIKKEKISSCLGTISLKELQAINDAICLSMNLSNQKDVIILKKQNEKLKMEKDIYKDFMINLIKK